jgi:hypothetical protein
VDPNAKLSDPKHHSMQRLAEFLAALSSQAPDPRAPAKELVKPQKLLKRLLPWLQKCRQVSDAACTAADSRREGMLKVCQQHDNMCTQVVRQAEINCCSRGCWIGCRSAGKWVMRRADTIVWHVKGMSAWVH